MGFSGLQLSRCSGNKRRNESSGNSDFLKSLKQGRCFTAFAPRLHLTAVAHPPTPASSAPHGSHGAAPAEGGQQAAAAPSEEPAGPGGDNHTGGKRKNRGNPRPGLFAQRAGGKHSGPLRLAPPLSRRAPHGHSTPPAAGSVPSSLPRPPAPVPPPRLRRAAAPRRGSAASTPPLR